MLLAIGIGEAYILVAIKKECSMTYREWLMTGFEEGFLNVTDVVQYTLNTFNHANNNVDGARADFVWACQWAAQDKYGDDLERPGIQ